MGLPVMILGESGSGKSCSLRNMNPKSVGVLNVAGKPLPFKRGREFGTLNHADYRSIRNALVKGKTKTFVIDDSQYLMAFESFMRANEKGYDKFTQMAVSFESLIRFIQTSLPDDVIVYFLHHVETDVNGKIKAKTIGKMLDSQLTVEGLFSIVLLCRMDNGEHFFETQSDGNTTAKTPMEMFKSVKIDNDLALVDKTIREYYGLTITNKEDNNNADN